MSNTISPAALRRLQVVYGKAAARSLDLGTSREERLAWAIGFTGRKVASFSDLYASEGKDLINALQLSMGIAETAPPRRQRTSTKDRQKMGTEGRHDQIHAETTMLLGNEPIFNLIRVELTALGWTEDRLKAFLRSASGPNKRRDTIHTLGDANRVHYALKRMASRTRKGAA